MAFVTPFWLLTLVPWAVFTAWILRGRRPRVRVPFLNLWRGPLPLEIPKRGWRRPPAWLILILGALLSAILGAARPEIPFGKSRMGASLTVVVDRGMSMSSTIGGIPRFKSVADQVLKYLDQARAPFTEIRLVDVVGEPQSFSPSQMHRVIFDLPVTAINTQEILTTRVHEELAAANGPLIVITDRPIAIADKRAIVVGPTAALEDVAVTHLAARAAPVPQVMVRLRNHSTRSQASIRVTSGEVSQERNVELPAPGKQRDYFFDVASLGEIVEARLLESDDQPANDRRWLVREGSNPRIELRTTPSPQLTRMIAVFARSRPPAADSPGVIVASAPEQLPADAPGIVVPSLSISDAARGSISVVSHSITRDVHWDALGAGVQFAPPPDGWEPLVSAGGKALVAIKGGNVRQVWVGFDAAGWAATTDFVVFWANVFSWAGSSATRYVDHALADFQPGWTLSNPPPLSPAPRPGQWPGLYRTAENSLLALSAPDEKNAVIAPLDWQDQLTRLREAARATTPLATPLFLAALAAIVGACATWGNNSTRMRTRESTFYR